MTQEDKNLLLKDLCIRLPYGVKIQESILWYEEGKEVWKYRDIDLSIDNINCINIDFIKPYLFPLSSMTEEQKVIYGDLCYTVIHSLAWDMQAALNELVDWLSKNHFDIYGLIPIGLAEDATGLNIY